MLIHLLIAFSVFSAQPAVSTEVRPAESVASAQDEMRITRDIRYARRPWTRKALTSLDVYQPGAVSDSPRSILLFIHGGGWTIGDKSRIEHKAQWATDQGSRGHQ